MIPNIGAWDPALLRPPVVEVPDLFICSCGCDGGLGGALTAEDIIELVAARLRVPVDELRGPKRTVHVAFARQVAMYLVRELTDLSFPDIGDLFDRDHSTAIHAHTYVMVPRMAREPAFRAYIEALKVDVRS